MWHEEQNFTKQLKGYYKMNVKNVLVVEEEVAAP